MSSNPNWELRVGNKVFKDLSRLPKSDQRVLSGAIRNLVVDPYGGDIQKMRGEDNSWRRRVGNYRIFYEILVANKIISVFHVERRSSNTY